MDFRIDATLPASAAQLWAIFFDVQSRRRVLVFASSRASPAAQPLASDSVANRFRFFISCAHPTNPPLRRTLLPRANPLDEPAVGSSSLPSSRHYWAAVIWLAWQR